MKKINVLSLFGGIECGRVAIDRLGWEIENYFSSEIDPYDIKQTKINYPDIIHIGSVTSLNYEDDFLNWIDEYGEEQYSFTQIDLLIGGSPCQDLSTAKANGKGLQGEKSGLFFEFIRILHDVKPKYFLLENVASMKKADRDEITRLMGVDPILINSSLVSAQNRKRLYWTNIPGVTQPQDKGILLKDILEDIPQDDKRWQILDKEYVKSLKHTNGYFYEVNKVGKLRQGYEYFTLNSKIGSFTCAHAANRKIIVHDGKNYIARRITTIEGERLQTLPDGFTKNLSKTRGFKTLANGWTSDVISHILSFIRW